MKIVKNIQTVPIEKVSPNEYNPKLNYAEHEHLQKEYDRLCGSLTLRGQTEPIIVRETKDGFEVVNGCHRLSAMNELGFTEVMVNNLGEMDLHDAIQYTYATDDIHFPIDAIEMAKLATSMKKEGANMIGMHRTEEEIEDMIKMLEMNMDEYAKKKEVEFDASVSGKEITCPKCEHVFTTE